MLNAFYNYKNKLITKEDLAKTACKIEIEICKSPIGKQDQYGCAIGGLNQINFLKDDQVNISTFDNDFNRLEKCLYLCYTGITRKANNILKIQSQNSKNKQKENLQLIAGVKQFRRLISSNKFSEVGDLLDKMWSIKKTMSNGISNEKINSLYEEGIKCGASGGKVLGAGGGGFILFYVPRKKQENFEKKNGKIPIFRF